MTALGALLLCSRLTRAIALVHEHEDDARHVGDPARARLYKAARKRRQEAHRDAKTIVAWLGNELAR